MQSIENIFQSTGLLHDRFFNESFQLPYDFEIIKIEGNDLCTFRVVNDALSKLYDNFLYLYGLTKMPSNAIPYALSGAFAVSGLNTQAAWYDNTVLDATAISPFAQVGWGGLDDTSAVTVAYSEIFNQFLMVSNTPNTLVISTVPENNTSFNILLSSSVADSATTLNFQNLVGTKIIGGYLYALDSYYNNVYRYDIAGFLLDDIFPKVLKIDSVIGGYGIFQDRYKFNNPTGMCVLNDNLLVLDAGNYCIKEFDKNLVSQNIYQYKSLFANDSAVFIEADNNSGKTFVVTASNLMYIFAPGFKSHDVVDLSTWVGTSSFVGLYPSKSFNNALYIVTSTDVFKIHINKPRNLIGKFSLYRFNTLPDEYLCIANVPSYISPKVDNFFAFANKDNFTYLIHGVDTPNYLDVLTLSDFEVFTKDEILINQHEYVQTWVLNKSIVKLLLNHLRLKDKIKGRFVGVYDSNNNPLLDGTLYFLLKDLDLTAYQITLDHFAGNNEVFATAVANRGLRKIYDLQQSIIAKSNTIIESSGYSENLPVSIG